MSVPEVQNEIEPCINLSKICINFMQMITLISNSHFFEKRKISFQQTDPINIIQAVYLWVISYWGIISIIPAAPEPWFFFPS